MTRQLHAAETAQAGELSRKEQEAQKAQALQAEIETFKTGAGQTLRAVEALLEQVVEAAETSRTAAEDGQSRAGSMNEAAREASNGVQTMAARRAPWGSNAGLSVCRTWASRRFSTP
jgi:methyl-accepting chemotaxis protein